MQSGETQDKKTREGKLLWGQQQKCRRRGQPMAVVLRQRISTTTHMRPMSWKSPGLAVVQGHSVAALRTAEGEHPNKIIAVCRCCPFLNPFIVPGTRTRPFLLSTLGCPAGPCGLSCFESHARHEDEFVPPLNHSCLSSNHIALNFFPVLGASLHQAALLLGWDAESRAAGGRCGREGGCKGPGALGTAAAQPARTRQTRHRDTGVSD